MTLENHVDSLSPRCQEPEDTNWDDGASKTASRDNGQGLVGTTVPCAHCGLPAIQNSRSNRSFCCNGCMGAYAMIHELGLEDFYALRDQGSKRFSGIELSGKGASFGYGTWKTPASLLDDLEVAGVPVETSTDGLCRVRLAVEGVHCAACAWLIDRVQPTIHGLHSAQMRMSDHTVELIYDPKLTHPKYVSRSFARLGYGLSPIVQDESNLDSFREQQREHLTGIALAAFFAANAMWIGVALYAGEASGMQPSHATFLRWVGTLLAVMAAIMPGRVFFQTAWHAIKLRTAHIDIPVALSLLIGIIGTVAGTISGTGHIYFDSLASLVLLLRIGRFIQFRAQFSASRSVSKLMRMTQVIATRVEPNGSVKKIPAHRLREEDIVLVDAGETIPADGIVVVRPSSSDANPEFNRSSSGVLRDNAQPCGSQKPAISTVDCSLLNGESEPLEVRYGDNVVGGTTNLSSPIYVQVLASGELTRIGRLMEMVRKATEHRTPWLMAADRVGKWFVILVLVIAVATWTTWYVLSDASTAIQHTIALLTIACPCALALAAPIVLTVAIGRAAKKRIWIRDGNCLERLARPGTMWLDKTGTLTVGRMKVLNWRGDDKWLEYAKYLEEGNSHPIAKAIADFVDDMLGDVTLQNGIRTVSITQPNNTPKVSTTFRQTNGVQVRIDGHDITIGNQAFMDSTHTRYSTEWLDQQNQFLRIGQSTVWLAVDGEVVGLFGLGDPLRTDAIETLLSIQKQGWKLGILSGDRQEIVDQVASQLSVHGVKWFAALGGQSPEEKLQQVMRSRHLSADFLDRSPSTTSTPTVVMVGDGINDSAALAAADVGIAIRGGCEKSLHSAPIYIADGKLGRVDELLKSSREVVKGIHRCFVASLLYNSGTISLAVLGMIHPLIAAVLMPISGITVLTMAICTKSFSRN